MCRRRPERNSSEECHGVAIRRSGLPRSRPRRSHPPFISCHHALKRHNEFHRLHALGRGQTSDTGGISQCQLRNALLPHNPRRCLVQPVLLTSNNRKESRFVTPSDLTSSASKLVEDATAPSALGAKTHGCTDFITIGHVEGPPKG